MKSYLHDRERLRKGFTLIEMLVVVTIIVLLLVFSTPALMRTFQSSRLASVGDSLMGAISEAQQIAYAQNVPVEIRFFKHGEVGLSDSPQCFRSYQLFKTVLVTEGVGAAMVVTESLEPVSNLVKLPDGIVIAASDELSAVLDGDGLPDVKPDASTGYSGVEGATYNAMRFMTDGSCRTVTTSEGGFAMLTYKTLPESFFTVTYDIGQELKTSNLPKNFYTIQIDPFTGKARNYRPGF